MQIRAGSAPWIIWPRLAIAIVFVHLRIIPPFGLQRFVQRGIKVARMDVADCQLQLLIDIGLHEDVFLARIFLARIRV